MTYARTGNVAPPTHAIGAAWRRPARDPSDSRLVMCSQIGMSAPSRSVGSGFATKEQRCDENLRLAFVPLFVIIVVDCDPRRSQRTVRLHPIIHRVAQLDEPNHSRKLSNQIHDLMDVATIACDAVVYVR